MAAHPKPAYGIKSQATPEEKLLRAIFEEERSDAREKQSGTAGSASGAFLRTVPQPENEDVILAYRNYKSLVDRVGDAFGDARKASTWLSSANPEYGNQTPLEFARERNYDVDVLEPALIRMEHGVFA